MKIVTKLIIAVSCLVVAYGVGICFAGVNVETVFKERLYKFLTAPLNPDFTTSKQKILSKENLLRFSEEFPDSRFADDARYIVIIYALTTKKDDVSLAELIEKYPDGKLEDATIEFLTKVCGGESHLISLVFMPYNLALAYIKGEKAIYEKNYNETVQNTLDFIKRVDEKDEKLKSDLRQAYRYLLISYKFLNNKEGAESIKGKIISLFPEEKEFVEKILASLGTKN